MKKKYTTIFKSTDQQHIMVTNRLGLRAIYKYDGNTVYRLGNAYFGCYVLAACEDSEGLGWPNEVNDMNGWIDSAKLVWTWATDHDIFLMRL